MGSLMILGGQFLQARGQNDREPTRKPDAFWDEVGAVENGVVDAYELAARLAAALVVLGVLFTGLNAASPSEHGIAQTACLECPAAPGRAH